MNCFEESLRKKINTLNDYGLFWNKTTFFETYKNIKRNFEMIDKKATKLLI